MGTTEARSCQDGWTAGSNRKQWVVRLSSGWVCKGRVGSCMEAYTRLMRYQCHNAVWSRFRLRSPRGTHGHRHRSLPVQHAGSLYSTVHTRPQLATAVPGIHYGVHRTVAARRVPVEGATRRDAACPHHSTRQRSHPLPARLVHQVPLNVQARSRPHTPTRDHPNAHTLAPRQQHHAPAPARPGARSRT